MDLQYLVSRRRSKDAHVRTVQKTVLFPECRINVLRYHYFFHNEFAWFGQIAIAADRG
jgi:hypothetical protein